MNVNDYVVRVHCGLSSLTGLCKYIANWSASCQLGFLTISQGAYVIPWDFYGESKPPTWMCQGDPKDQKQCCRQFCNLHKWPLWGVYLQTYMA